MMTRVLNFIQNVQFVLSLSELIMGLSVLVLITVLVLGVNKIVRTIIKERIIDEHMRETRARIARAATEIEVCKEVTMPEVGDKINSQIIQTQGELATEVVETSHNNIGDNEEVMEDDVRQNTNTQIQNIQNGSVEIPKEKKTRAMSMEERWADFDKKRSRMNTA
ncbi:MAG: hypothetical protein P4L69_05615 [Desulfosporosinus sp.]|nr:hypothetical protein [Desulfosporosinus sp.]